MKQGIWVERNVCCKAGRTEGHRRERLHKIPSRLWLQERRSLEDDQQVYHLLVTCEGLHLWFSDNLTLISKAQHFDILMVLLWSLLSNSISFNMQCLCGTHRLLKHKYPKSCPTYKRYVWSILKSLAKTPERSCRETDFHSLLGKLQKQNIHR